MVYNPQIDGIGVLRVRAPRTAGGTITGASTTVVAAVSGSTILVARLYLCNLGSGNCQSVYVKYSSSSTHFFESYLPAYGGKAIFNLVQNELDEGAEGDSLALVMDTTNSPNVHYTLGYLYRALR